MSDGIKACRCGNDLLTIDRDGGIRSRHYEVWWIKCGRCFNEIVSLNGKDWVIMEWNKRV